MENNKNIDTIDTLMIAQALSQNGYKIVRAGIRNHRFIIPKSTSSKPSRYIMVPNPYSITYRCSRDDNSILSKQIFNKIDTINSQKIIFEIKNQHNEYSKNIDKCTQWEPIKNSNNIEVTTTFHNKKELVTTLNTLHKMNSHEKK
jgi:hypothetical protein